MANELTLQTDVKPTYFNKEAAIGTFIFPIVGTAIGAYIGKKRMEQEAREGKHVSENHSWLNKDMLLGALIGRVAGRLILGKAALAAATTATGATFVSAFLPVALIVAGAAVLGAFIGNKIDERNHAAEYEQAKKQTIVRHLSETVSPEVGQAMKYTMEHNKNWAKDVAEERLLADAQRRLQ